MAVKTWLSVLRYMVLLMRRKSSRGERNVATSLLIMPLVSTAVMAPEQYPFLDSGQLSGMLTGMKGAAEYEQLIEAPGLGMPAMAGQSAAHLYIFLLIVLGNLSLIVGWLQRRRPAR